MQQRRSLPDQPALDQRLKEMAVALRKQALLLPPGSHRDELERKADQMDHAIEVYGWVRGECAYRPR